LRNAFIVVGGGAAAAVVAALLEYALSDSAREATLSLVLVDAARIGAVFGVILFLLGLVIRGCQLLVARLSQRIRAWAGR
jgi:Zn-dependent membrane protease YugP